MQATITKRNFNFISAMTWSNWDAKPITFWGNSGYYLEQGGSKYIIWDGGHVATKYRNVITFNPNEKKLPRGFKTACKSL